MELQRIIYGSSKHRAWKKDPLVDTGSWRSSSLFGFCEKIRAEIAPVVVR